MREVTKPDAFEVALAALNYVNRDGAYETGHRDGARFGREWTLREDSSVLVELLERALPCLDEYFEALPATIRLELKSWKEKCK